MQILDSIASARSQLPRDARIAFVPTMGNLHAGHIALMRQAHAHADTVVASIFVNRLQFGPNEDFDRYPRTFAEDSRKLEDAGVSYVFAPAESDFYPEPQCYGVALPDIENTLEGAIRPGHFRGMATVVLKLFNIIQPQVAVFGQKDYQQLMIIRNMVRQLALPIDVVSGATVRADDGLALSSRNAYLSPSERREAPRLHRVLSGLQARIRAGETDFAELESVGQVELDQHGWKPDYVAVRKQTDLKSPPQGEDTPLVILAAARIGSTRLIDNLEV